MSELEDELSPESVPPATGRRRTRSAVDASPAPIPPSHLKVVPLDDELEADPYVGMTIDGRYTVEAVLGEGGMGIVYRCTHSIIGKKVAMKVLRSSLVRTAEVRERFLNEAKAASAIGNPHIIDISDFGTLPDGSTYFVMEYLSGEPLAHALDGGRALPVPRILHIAQQLAQGLAAAHARGIVHRDLKPDNIFLIERGGQKDFVKVLDFGIAKVSSASDSSRLTVAGAVFGTPHYMSPEQAAGVPVDQRGDVYSFGVILYEMATGQLPFDAEDFRGILSQQIYKTPMPLRALDAAPPELPPGLEAIVLKCLSKLPGDRYQNMEQVLLDLHKLENGIAPDAIGELRVRSQEFNVPPEYFGGPASRPPWKRFGVRLAALTLIAIAGGVAALLVFRPGPRGDVTGRQHDAPVAARALANDAPPTAIAPAAAATAPSAAARTTPSTPPPAQVVLAVEPLDAHVFQGDRDLGQSPVMLQVPAGESLALEVRRTGYKTRKLALDGSEPRRVLKLEHSVHAVAADSHAPVTGSSSRVGGNGIVDPWSH